MLPVKTLTELRRILDPKLDELFVETNDARDPEVSRRNEIAEILDGPNAKVLLTGHGGTGKSTELVKFCAEREDRFTFVQMSISVDGDPFKVTVEGLLVLIAEAVLRQIRDRGIEVDEAKLAGTYARFNETFKTRMETTDLSAEAGAGLAIQESFVAKLLGLTATLKGGIKAGSTIVSTTVQENPSRLPDLAAHCGDLIREASLAVFEDDQTDLVLVVDDLDKIDVEPADRLFIDNPTPLASLPVRAVFTGPFFLFCNPRSAVLDSSFETVTIPIIKVGDQDDDRYEPGWQAIRKILAQRIDLEARIDADAIDLAIGKTCGVLRISFRPCDTRRGLPARAMAVATAPRSASLGQMCGMDSIV